MYSIFKKQQPKPTEPPKRTAKDLEYAFTDNAGIRYYRINTQLGVGLEHYGKAMEFTMWMAAGLQPKELDIIVDALEKAWLACIEGKQAHAVVGACIMELRTRRTLVLHLELLYNFIACHYIREDEPLTEWIESIHSDKVDSFKEIVKKTGDEYGFFLGFPELRNLTEISSMSREGWNKRSNESTKEVKDLRIKVNYMLSVIESAKSKKTTKRAS